MFVGLSNINIEPKNTKGQAITGIKKNRLINLNQVGVFPQDICIDSAFRIYSKSSLNLILLPFVAVEISIQISSALL